MHAPGPPHPLASHLRPSARRHDAPARVLDLSRLWLGLTVITVGVLFLLDGAGVLSADRTIDDWWPVLLVIAGLLTLTERPPSLVRGTLLTTAGAVLLLFTTDLVAGNGWDYVWPALVIAAGLVILTRWHGRTIAGGVSEEDVIRSTAVFGGPKLVCTSRRFQGAWLTAVFGGITLDLRHATPAPTGASVNVTAAFGGVDILVPKGWRLSVRSTPIFGGLDDKTDHTEPPAEDAPMLHIDAVTVFGGVDIKHAK